MSEQGRLAVVFVHGFSSNAKTWDSFTNQMLLDDDLKTLGIFPFEYSTQIPRTVPWRPDRSLPTLSTIADSFQTYLDIEASGYQRLVIVCHSMGGLVVQRYLQRMLNEGRGLDLQRIQRVVMFATPNAGSDFARKLRKDLLGSSHPQERDLRTLSEEIRDTHTAVIRDVVHASEPEPGKCPIQFNVFAATDDKIVPRASAQGTFPKVGALPGDHFSIINPTSPTHRSYTTLRQLLLETAADSDPPPRRREMSPSAGATTPSTILVSEFRPDFHGTEWEHIYHEALEQQSSESVSVVDKFFYPGAKSDVIISVRSAESVTQDQDLAKRAILRIYTESSHSRKKVLVGICAIGAPHEDAKRLIVQWVPVEAEGSFYIEGSLDGDRLYVVITRWIQNAIRRNSPRMRDGSRIERLLDLPSDPYGIPGRSLL
ncbi:alpha/beta fold hydrolase [Streptomyces sp. NPDC026665]|uniref:esterase/lipase family protein n=1 Tax=Streptomyces sp. NPDC026665 TaxID=3154798 RepID=UPI0033F36F54